MYVKMNFHSCCVLLSSDDVGDWYRGVCGASSSRDTLVRTSKWSPGKMKLTCCDIVLSFSICVAGQLWSGTYQGSVCSVNSVFLFYGFKPNNAHPPPSACTDTNKCCLLIGSLHLLFVLHPCSVLHQCQHVLTLQITATSLITQFTTLWKYSVLVKEPWFQMWISFTDGVT